MENGDLIPGLSIYNFQSPSYNPELEANSESSSAAWCAVPRRAVTT